MKRPNGLRPIASVLTLSMFALALGSYPLTARADNEGQADLDQATQQKIGAQKADDLADVIKLCESALKKGLDKNNTAFANDLIASSLAQRGSLAAAQVYREVRAAGSAAAADEGWKTLRTEALADLEKAVKLSPKQPQAQFEIAKLNALPGGDPQRAIAALDLTIKYADDDATLHADALLQRSTLQKDPKKRLADLNEAARVLPGNAVVIVRRALLEAETGKSDEALADFDKAIAADPKQIGTYKMKAELLLRLKKLPEALAVLEKGHQAAPRDLELLVGKSEIYIARSNYKAAAEELTRALAIDAANVQLLQLRAALYEKLGDKPKLLGDVEKMMELKPGQPQLMHLRAALLADMGKYDKAIKALEDLHRADPNDSLTLLQLAMLYTTTKKYDKAIELYGKVLADHPDDVDAMRGRADAYLNLGKRVAAAADYEKAIKLQPHDVGILNNFAWLLATAPEDNLRDGHRALALATDACRQTDYKADYILSTLAAACAETGDFENARKWSAQAVAAKPRETDEPSRKDELRKELDSYKVNKPWREALPEDDKKVDEKKASVDDKKDGAVKKDGSKSDAAKKKKKKKNPAPKPQESDSTPK